MAAANLTAARAREVLSYDPETGALTRRIRSANMVVVGEVAGCLGTNGYIMVSVNGKQYRAHRLAWLIQTGEWPPADIDHLNGIRTDNRWANLRAVSRSVNNENQRAAKATNKSAGLLGVSFIPRLGKFRALIRVGGKNKHIGMFLTAEAAHQAYVAEKRRLHSGCTL